MEKKLNKKIGKFNKKIANVVDVFTQAIKEIELLNTQLTKEKNKADVHAEKLTNHSKQVADIILKNDKIKDNINKIIN